MPAGANAAGADVPVVTIIADFEDDSVAATIANVQNVLRTGCALDRPMIPARGQHSLQLDIGVTGGEASAVVDLRLREPRRFAPADRIAAFCWLNDGAFDLAFRIRDAREQVFETPPQPVTTANRWIRVESAVNPEKLKRIQGDGELVWPIQVQGYRASTDKLGKQTLYLDDLQVEHRVDRRDMIHGEFVFNEPTRIYEPGATVGAAVALENSSRSENLQITVELAWTRPDGTVLKTQTASKTLPASGLDFRSRQAIDFSQKIDQPGLYRLVARARASGWITPAVFQTSIAVTPSNRLVARGRSTFYAVRSDLLSEPPADQRLEIAIARDIGVHLLAIETPWRQIEPAAGKFDFALLDPVISDLTTKGIVPMIVLTNPPEWAAAGPERIDAVAAAFGQLAKKYGAALPLFQPEQDALGAPALYELPAALERIQTRLKQVRENAAVVSPPIPVTPAAATQLAPHLSSSSVQWCLQTEGETHAALAALEEFRRTAGLNWQASHWWLHRTSALVGPTHFVDAEAVLDHYVRASLAGIGGLIWYDLRDGDNDSGRPDALRGLVRRDFSPKASLLGYATAAGMLTGLTCRGPVDGTPPEFESAVFIGSDRHVAVVLPKPNRIRPAVLVPVLGAPGKLELRDFERRAYNALSTLTTPLVPTLDRPFFITLPLKNPQPEPQLAFAEPWIRVPACAFCGETPGYAVELTAPQDVQRGAVRVTAPKNSPLQVDSARQSFKIKQGETQQFTLDVPCPKEKVFERAAAALKLSFEAASAEIPIEVLSLTAIRPAGSGWPGVDRSYRLAELAAPEGRRASAAATVFGAFGGEFLDLVINVQDDRNVPYQVLADGTATGDALLLGIAGQDDDRHAEVRLDMEAEPPRIVPVCGLDRAQAKAWWCAALPAPSDKERVFHVRVPAAGFGMTALRAGAKVRLAVRYQDDDADGLPPTILCWGRGLDGSRSSAEFLWLKLVDK